MINARKLNRQAWTFQACAEYLKGKNRKQIANNTVIGANYANQADEDNHRNPISYFVRLHQTIIFEVFPDNSVKLNSGEYKTNTTKQRINSFSPASIWQRRGEWYIAKDVLFFDGIILSADGIPRNAGEVSEAAEQELREHVKAKENYRNCFA